MRKVVLIGIIIAGILFWANNFVRSGQFEQFLDTHPNPELNSRIEFYWAFLLDLANRDKSAEYRYNRVIEKYPHSAQAPGAWAALIELFYEEGFNDKVTAQGTKFLEQYPQHEKAEIIRRKLSFIRNGY